MWEKQFTLDGDSTNYESDDFGWTTCAAYPCKQVSKTVTITKPKAFVAYIQSNGGAGGDTISAVLLNGANCAVSRMPASPGTYGYANSTCVKWLAPGTHTITIRAYGDRFSGTASGGILLL